MRSCSTEPSSRSKELRSSFGIPCSGVSLPNITTLMRSDFLPLMQCLEQSNDVLCNIYNVEIAFTLARFDAFLREEEKRLFVCAFDALVGRLLKDLHHFMEQESLLHQNVLFLRELVKRCQMVEHICNCRISAAAPAGDGVGIRTEKSIMSRHSTDDIGEEIKSQRKLTDLYDSCIADFSLTQSQQVSCGDMTSPATETGNVNVNASATHEILGLTNSAQQDLQPLTSFLETLPPQSLSARQTPWWCEEFWEFIGGRMSRSDVVAMVSILQPRCSKRSSSQNVDDAHEDAMSSGTTRSAYTNENNISSNICLGAHATPVDITISKRKPKITEEIDNFARRNSSFRLEETTDSSNLAISGGGRFICQTAVYLSMFIEGLLHCEPRAVFSVNSTSDCMANLEPRNIGTESVAVPQRSETVSLGFMIGQLTALPSPAALALLRTLFPSLCTYAGGFARLSKLTGKRTGGGCDSNSFSASPSDCSRGGLCSFQRHKSVNDNVDGSSGGGSGAFAEDSGGPIHLADVVFLCFLRSFCDVDNDIARTTLQMGDAVQSVLQPALDEDSAATLQEKLQDGAMTVTLPHRIGMELERMITHIQESITSVQAMQEQIREEVTLLAFRVVSTIVYHLIPAVQCVDQRSATFYRKWICDVYRFLWEEKLLGRFSCMVAASMPLPTGENISLTRSPFRSTHPATPRRGGSGAKRHTGKGRSTSTVALASANKSTNRSFSQKESGDAPTNEAIDEGREDAIERIAPGNAYSCTARRLTDRNFETMSKKLSGLTCPSMFFGAGAVAVVSAKTTDVTHHELGIFDDPAVLVAESLLENPSAEKLPPSGFIVTRLMAALLRDRNTDKLRNFAAPPEDSLRGGGNSTTQAPELQPGTHSKTAFASRNVKQPSRKKNLVFSQQFSTTMKTTTSSSDFRNLASQQHPGTRYPAVANAEDVRALYYSALSDAEIALSPLDPIRAALLHNTVDYLVTVMRNPREAYDLLDAYLDDVSIEPIQPLTTKCVAPEIVTEGLGCGGAYEYNNSDSNSFSVLNLPFSSSSIRRAKQMSSDAPVGILGKTSTSNLAHAAQTKRGFVVDKEAGTAATKLLVFPSVIPLWNSTEVNDQFLVILAILRRVYSNLQTELSLVSL